MKLKQKTILGVLALASVLTLLPPNNTKAASTSGSTSVSVTLPDVIILHYFSGITLNFNTDIEDPVNESAGSSWTVSWDGTSSSTDELTDSNLDDMTVTATDLDGGTVTVNIPNVWAIRGFSSDGTATVEIDIDDSELTATATGSSATIAMSDEKVDDNNGHVGDPITAALNGIRKTNATIGDVNLTFDFTNAVESGSYTGGQYTITATAV